MAEKELACADLFLELIPAVAFFHIGLPEIKGLLVDVSLDVVQ